MLKMMERLERVERENRWLKRAGIVVLVGILAAMIMGQARGAPPVVEAQKFFVKDPRGGKAAAAR